jgi:hypothetical protein
MARKLTDTVQLKLRFDEKLRRRLEREAAQNARSMNAEIIQRLEQSFQQQDQKEFIKTVTQASATAAVDQALARFQRRGGLPIVENFIPRGQDEAPEPAKPENSSQKDKRS